MPRRISAEEATRLGAVPVEAPRRRISAAEAERLKATPVDEDELPPPAEPDPLDMLKPERPLGAAMGGALQGATLGFSDEMLGAVGVAEEVGKRGLQALGLEDEDVTQAQPAHNPNGPDITKSWGPTQRGGDKPVITQDDTPPPKPDLADVYRSVRDDVRSRNKSSEKAQPLAYGASELVGNMAVPIPGSAAVKGASLASRMGAGAKAAAKFGGVLGAGKSESDSLDGVAGDAAMTAAVAAPFGAVGGAMEKGAEALANRFGARAAAVRKVRDEAIKDTVEAERASLLGKARSATQEASRDVEVLARPGDPRSLPVQAQVNRFVDSREASELADKIATSKLASAPDRIKRMDSTMATHDAFAADATNEVARRIATQEKKGIASEAMPRLRTYANRIIPPAIGSIIGGAVTDDKATGATVGAVAGGVLAATMGSPGTAFANMMKSPAFRIGIAEMKQGASNAIGNALGRFGPAVAGATSEAGLRAVLAEAEKDDPALMGRLEAATQKPRTLEERFGK